MEHFPYTPSPSKVGKFLDHMQDAGVPQKVTIGHLESVGFKSNNDRYLIPVFKSLDFLDSSGSPTGNWKSYRDKSRAKQVLSAALKTAYSDLFSTYPDAERKDDEALHNYFASKTGLSKKIVDRIVRTFRVLSEKAEFDTAALPSETPPPKGSPERAEVSTPLPPTVTISVQLQLPATDDASVYDNLFAAMKKHLFS